MSSYQQQLSECDSRNGSGRRSHSEEHEKRNADEKETVEHDPTGLSFLAASREFWLDLRGSAITPQQAISFLEQQVIDDDDSAIPCRETTSTTILELVDGILLSEEAFFREMSSSSSRRNTELSRNSVRLMYATDEGENLVTSSDETEQSFLNGKIMSVIGYPAPETKDRESIILDPIAALEAVTGVDPYGWVVVDTSQKGRRQSAAEEDQSSSAWLAEQVSSLIAFLSASLLSSPSSTTASTGTEEGYTSPPSGLLVPLTNEFGTGYRDGRGSGGIAVCCRSRQTLVQLDAAMLEAAYTSQMMISTIRSSDTGLVVPTGILMQQQQQQQRPLLRTALVLPFDGVLWKTAMELQSLLVGNAPIEEELEEDM